MSDSQNFSDNDDLLSILGSSLSSSTTDVVTGSVSSTNNGNLPAKSEDDIEVDKKLSDLRDLADALQQHGVCPIRSDIHLDKG